MSDFFEIDFLEVESSKSGDAIPLRYRVDGVQYVHVVDGGFQATGESIVDHISAYYGDHTYIDHVIVTHPDGDHAGGLRTVLETCGVGTLWMLRPWTYAEQLIERFSHFTSVPNLAARLREVYPAIAELETIAHRRGVPISEPFQGSQIGMFTVLAPTRERYLDLVVRSGKTPVAIGETDKTMAKAVLEELRRRAGAAVSLIRAAWGEETFSAEGTSSENEMSVVQYAELAGKRILLTGDTGRDGLSEAADFALARGVPLPGIDRFQVPHHGSRRNVSSEVLDRWLGPILASSVPPGEERFSALISSALEDDDHPRKAVVRAMVHRGGKVVSTEGKSISTGNNAPSRPGWGPVTPMAYPDQQEK